MIYLFILTLILLGYLFYKDHKNALTIREILSSKISQETFEKTVGLQKEVTPPPAESKEPLLDEVDADELYNELMQTPLKGEGSEKIE